TSRRVTGRLSSLTIPSRRWKSVSCTRCGGGATRAMTSPASGASTMGTGSGAFSPSRPAIDAAIAAHVGIPYRHGGRGPDGLDCLGLVASFYRTVGIEVPDSDGTPYPPDWWRTDPNRYLRRIMEHGKPVEGPLQAL